ncbi:hypothetical protein BO83DRAFT_175920 [Aspergillus eucalypticola CBS 122712]|uniref:Uncharacterized protein n=1 Tax=Aspergillus eucalypticola (strain CBS 122712 / IBT 29274) TaxID=1448314 RepID=A0A317W5P4_ASPEC|nr:uncharacterized protein BO83DRAFT_175920 [Aspergillus eucalypticola CBS 122712]PWY81399.1 hypothetical protein BO83DRAFT_175920 [Aspergillus eucalypticola CBS 122712]
MLLAFTFFYHFFCHPGAARFLFYDFFSAFVLLNRMPFPSLPFSRLDSTSCSEQNKGGNGNKGQKWKKERQYIHGLGCDAFGPENENENVERVHVVAGFFYSTSSEL